VRPDLVALPSRIHLGGIVAAVEETVRRGYSDDKAAVLKRLRRIEGQVRGLQRMVEEDRYCIDVLEQISAATRALQSVALQLLEGHMGHCVAEAVRSGGDQASEKLSEASAAIARLVRS
jgi:DNA-binding FrmR family transcriptional regulator